MIDPFHLEAYGKTAVNYNRDIEIFPVVNAMFEPVSYTHLNATALAAATLSESTPWDMGILTV